MQDERFSHGRFLIEQLMRPMINLYQVTPLAVGGDVMTAQERSVPMAIARRIADFVPYGELVAIPYNFDLVMDGRTIGHMNRKLQFRDRYVLDLTGDHERRLDRRKGIALAVGLDTLQNR